MLENHFPYQFRHSAPANPTGREIFWKPYVSWCEEMFGPSAGFINKNPTTTGDWLGPQHNGEFHFFGEGIVFRFRTEEAAITFKLRYSNEFDQIVSPERERFRIERGCCGSHIAAQELG